MFNPDELKLYILRELNKPQIFDDRDMQFVAQLLNRDPKHADPFVLIGPLVELVAKYNAAPAATPYEDYVAQWKIVNTMNLIKNTCFRQPNVLIACPQRKRHLPEGAPPPNIGSLVIPQSIRAIADQCFGLDHAGARNYFVEKALRPGSQFTHILFVDDDQLLRQDTLQFLLSYQLEAVGCNYTKRNAQLESIATQLVSHPQSIYQNDTVSCEDPTDLTPTLVNAIGLGAFLITTDSLRKLPAPWFFFTHEQRPDGELSHPVVGEDSNLVRSLIRVGVPTYIIPGGPVSPHCSFEESKAAGKGVFYGPTWLVNPDTREIRPEHVNKYTKFMVPPGDLYVPYDNDTREGVNVFGKRKQAAA